MQKVHVKAVKRNGRLCKLTCFIEEIGTFDAADLDRDLIAERLKKDDVIYYRFTQYTHDSHILI